jgi:CRISPR/Cas system CSM-associated protein Csm3 (group 7 of RAMP superfamily)
MISRHVFELHLQAKTPLFFGGSSTDLLKKADGRPMVGGNSIRGVLREWLNRNAEYLQLETWKVMGGEQPEEANKQKPEENGRRTQEQSTAAEWNTNERDSEQKPEAPRRDFIRSRIQVDDGELTLPPEYETDDNKLPRSPKDQQVQDDEKAQASKDHQENQKKQTSYPRKERNAIDPATGTALSHAKFTYEYLPAGTEVRFRITCDIRSREAEHDEDSLTEEKLKRMISAWAAAINRGEVRFGGKKSVHHGICEVRSVQWHAYDFRTFQDVEAFLFSKSSGTGMKPEPSRSALLEIEPAGSPIPVVRLQMQGYFPYGVYISDYDRNMMIFEDGSPSSKAIIPASSLKGLMRHEVRRLVLRLLDAEGEGGFPDWSMQAGRFAEWLFGGPERAGLVTVCDMVICGQEVQVNRPDENDKGEDNNSDTDRDRRTDEQLKKSDKKPVYIKIDRITGGVVESQLKTQREVQGYGTIELEVRLPDDIDSPFDADCAWFPLIYALRRIGAGLLPVGGRTSIGLGQFHADDIQVIRGNEQMHTLSVADKEKTEQRTLEWLRRSYDRFRKAVSV